MKKITCIVNENGGLCNPSSLFYDRITDELYICDMGNARVTKYLCRFNQLQDIQQKNQEKCLLKPLAITMDGSSRLLVTDALRNCIFQYRERSWFEIVLDIEMNLPGSITTGEANCIYVSDFHNNRIIKWSSHKKVSVLEHIPCFNIYGIFYRTPYLYITDTGHKRIVRYHTLLNEFTILWRGISPIAVTVSEDDNIFFSENRQLYCLFSNGEKRILLNSKLCMDYNLGRLYHIGAITTGHVNQLFFSDTIKNCVYEVILR